MTSALAEAIPVDVADYLRRHHVITLSTTSFTGMPHANTVTYATDDHRLYFVASPSAQITRNIRDNHYVSYTIDDYTTDWRKVRELQGVGRCMPLHSDDQAAVVDRFTDKFGAGYAQPSGTMHAIDPSEMHFVDYSYQEDAAMAEAEPQVSRRSFQFGTVDDAASPLAMSTSLNRTSYNPGDVIFRPGEPAQFYVVIAGEVEVRREGYGADQTVTRLRPGQLFGHRGPRAGQPGALTAHAVAATELLAVPREAIRDLLYAEEGGERVAD